MTNKNILNKVQEEKDELHDIRMEIRDLEAELEWMHSREPDEYKYIGHIEARINELYNKWDKLSELNQDGV
tara:strand:+ start:773 stop:985 length:213 start_codon:yes stop_codon:yes gene_type:complete